MYIAVTDFRDLRDGGYQYKKGDTYPRKGVALDADRVTTLLTPTPMRGALIEEVKEAKKKTSPSEKKAVKK